MKVKLFLLDDIMKSPDGLLKKSELIVDFETKSFKDLKEELVKSTTKALLQTYDKQGTP